MRRRCQYTEMIGLLELVAGPRTIKYNQRSLIKYRPAQQCVMWGAGSTSGGLYMDVQRVAGPNFQVVPGPGLAKLRAATMVLLAESQPRWANTDLAFLSNVVCSGWFNGPPSLTSLTGLDNVVDGVPLLGDMYGLFYFLTAPNLTNVSALNAYGRCGTPTQRADGPNLPRPAVKVKGCTVELPTWAALCNYTLYGACPGGPIPPNSPPLPPPPPPPLLSPPPAPVSAVSTDMWWPMLHTQMISLWRGGAVGERLCRAHDAISLLEVPSLLTGVYAMNILIIV
jgi:hypothetical protein